MKIEWKTSDHLIDYPDAVNFMEERIESIKLYQANEMIWLLEHPSIYTAGSSANQEDLIDSKQLPIFNTGRGGKYTYHGPGQRVVYIMLNLKERGSDLHKFVENIENWVSSSLEEFGINCFRKEDMIGVWTKNILGRDVKIAAIGIRVRKWVSYHGVAINVNPNMDLFKGIIACGIKDYGVTSLAELGIDASFQQLDEVLKRKFYDFF